MATVCFTANLRRHVTVKPGRWSGATVRDVLNAVFEENASARGYVLDDQGALRKHMIIFVDGSAIRDRVCLSDPVAADGEIYVMQALSGG